MAIGVNWKEIWAQSPSVWKAVWTQSPPVQVPDVVGLAQAQGTSDLEAVGFVVAVDTAYSSLVAAGLIISQDPAAGSTPGTGATVTIVVSLGDAPAPTPPPQSDASGGWVFYLRYEQERERRRRRRLEEEDAAEAVEQLADPVTKEIAQLLQKQERADERRQDLERLKRLATEFADTRAERAVSERVADAFERARARQTVSSLLNLEKELRRMYEEEEFMVLVLGAL